MQSLEEPAAEVADAVKPLPELLVKRSPAYKLGLTRWHAVQSLC